MSRKEGHKGGEGHPQVGCGTDLISLGITQSALEQRDIVSELKFSFL